MLHGLLDNLYLNQLVSWKIEFLCGLGKNTKFSAKIRVYT
jgi:hypothetical protein